MSASLGLYVVLLSVPLALLLMLMPFILLRGKKDRSKSVKKEVVNSLIDKIGKM